MPISLPFETQRISQVQFGKIAYEVMQHVFAIHNEYGRFFNERIFKVELANRLEDVELELPITVTFQDFAKRFYLDVLVKRGGLFEFKAADAIHPQHRAQTINYLLLTDLAHAKIVNIRPESVEHDFVDCHHRLENLRNPAIEFCDWDGQNPEAIQFLTILMSLVNDWGVGLQLSLYQEALCHFLHGTFDIPVVGSAGEIGTQKMHLATPEIAFELTSHSDDTEKFAIHFHRMLIHTRLTAIFWANLTTEKIQIRKIQR